MQSPRLVPSPERPVEAILLDLARVLARHRAEDDHKASQGEMVACELQSTVDTAPTFRTSVR